ncbi:hypothetical protein CDN99_27790 [Roseateles aquatilis]|uniref:Uncharacterized protein n=1 Tax=Roseateles aquatilis TaxID=431061 RepID=A0A2D0ALQ5_9BURK|nr:hypothetical protein [Roseateles aquatilis]OWQ82912.1 hypothetical protein CDN99_27790 [Roseateles aquatilis]
MTIVLEVVKELFAMFWADAGLCIGSLVVVAIAGLGFRLGWLDGTSAAVVLVGGIVAVLLGNVWRAKVRAGRRLK